MPALTTTIKSDELMFVAIPMLHVVRKCNKPILELPSYDYVQGARGRCEWISLTFVFAKRGGHSFVRVQCLLSSFLVTRTTDNVPCPRL